MSESNLFSIGHGHKTAEEFISELRSFGIQFLIDVRSSPFSKWAPDFNKGVIENLLRAADITYSYWGDLIGGRPTSDDCYDEEGRFDYHKMAETPAFKQGLQRLVEANNRGFRVAVMCSESDPSECHRSKLIGRELYFAHHIDMLHITAPTKAISEPEIIEQLTKGGWSETSLFPIDPPYFKSRNVYKKQPKYNEAYD